MGRWGNSVVFIAYEAVAIATFFKLTFFDGYVYNAWNWVIAIPVNALLSHIWPIYWLLLKPILG